MDSRVTSLATRLLQDQYFDNASDAWRAATRLVRELDLMTVEETGGVARIEHRHRAS